MKAVAFVHDLNPTHALPMHRSLKPPSLEASQQSQTDLQAREICRNPSVLVFETKIFNSNREPTKSSQLIFQPTIRGTHKDNPKRDVQTSKETVRMILIHHLSAIKMPRSQLLFLKATSILLPHPILVQTRFLPRMKESKIKEIHKLRIERVTS
jgi:hypothetical protein